MTRRLGWGGLWREIVESHWQCQCQCREGRGPGSSHGYWVGLCNCLPSKLNQPKPTSSPPPLLDSSFMDAVLRVVVATEVLPQKGQKDQARGSFKIIFYGCPFPFPNVTVTRPLSHSLAQGPGTSDVVQALEAAMAQSSRCVDAVADALNRGCPTPTCGVAFPGQGPEFKFAPCTIDAPFFHAVWALMAPGVQVRGCLLWVMRPP